MPWSSSIPETPPLYFYSSLFNSTFLYRCIHFASPFSPSTSTLSSSLQHSQNSESSVMGGKKKRQETESLRSSSMRRDSSLAAAKTVAHQTTHHVGNIGCMSGIFHFVSKYHTRRKFLTFGSKKQENKAKSQPIEKPQTPENATCQQHDHEDSSAAKLLLEVPRSPAIPAEIRKTSLESLNSPRVVARLMGLDNTPADTPAPVEEDSAVEKRRRLLGALERCDEDLQALKKIILAVRASQTPPLTTPRLIHHGGVKDEDEEEEREDVMVGSEEPSPVSVLDHHMLLTRSPSISCSKRTRQGEIVQQQRQQTSRKKQVEEDKASFCFQYRPYPSSTMVTTSPQSLHFPSKIRQLNIPTTPSPATPWLTTMRETVMEVCRDVERGQRREVATIGLLLQDIICRDLIDEIILELKCLRVSCSYNTHSLPNGACKKKLCF